MRIILDPEGIYSTSDSEGFEIVDSELSFWQTALSNKHLHINSTLSIIATN